MTFLPPEQARGGLCPHSQEQTRTLTAANEHLRLQHLESLAALILQPICLGIL